MIIEISVCEKKRRFKKKSLKTKKVIFSNISPFFSPARLVKIVLFLAIQFEKVDYKNKLRV